MTPRSSQSLSRAAFAAVLSVALTGAAQSSPSSPPVAPPNLNQTTPQAARASSHRISGKVVDAHSGAPLGNATVRIATVKESSETQSTTAGGDGSFHFDALLVGKYTLSADHAGYVEESYEQHDQYSTAIAVGPGLTSEGLIFKLNAEGIISGTVIDEAGEPVRNAQVRLFQDEDTNGNRATRQRETVNTDDRGMYELANLRPGAYFLVVTAHPWYAQRLRQMQSNGEEQDAQGQPLDVAYPVTYYPGVTDQDAATPIPIKGGDRLEADITLAAQQAMRLQVKMPANDDPGGEGFPRNGLSVVLSQSIFGQVEALPVQSVAGRGSFEIEGVLPGHYDVTVSHFVPGQGEGATKHFSTDITSGMTELAEDTALDAIAVTGKVLAQNGKLPPMSGISLRTANTRRPQYGPINDAGEFTIEAAPGAYEVVGNINGMHFMSLKATGAQLTGRTLTIKTGDTPKLEIVAGTGHGEIEGIALLDGKAVGGVMVLLTPVDPKNNEILFRRDQSDSDGSFDLTNIFPGRYRLLAIQNGWELEWANANILQAFLAKSVPLEVKPGDHLKQTVEVQAR